MARIAEFTVTLSTTSSQSVSVSYTTVPGTAVAPSDFTAKSGVVFFAPGETEKKIQVEVRDDIPGNPEEQFTVVLSAPVNGTINDGTGVCILPGGGMETYLDRFNWMYTRLKDFDNGYFGPPTGPKAFGMPYHSVETLIVEAPDHGHQSVSETASFWVGLEVWKGILSNSWTGYAASWTSIENHFIPSTTNQPVGAYDPALPATYQPEGNEPSDYPTLPDPEAPVGFDPLFDELSTTYGNDYMYLMHWFIDVDGVYGYHNGDGSTTGVLINNYQRGMHESTWETVTHQSYEDFTFGNEYGMLPIFNQSTPTYPSAPFAYEPQWRYTCAPDAEARVIQYAYLAHRVSPASVTAQSLKAKKMGDYLRYALFDKYFRQIGNSDEGGTVLDPYASCHFLISWYVAWGGGATLPSAWGFRIGSSESHQGYQAPNVAYAMATGGGGYSPLSDSAGDIWLGSMHRQIEMLRWLQSPEGPIAGGVTNSWLGRYETPTDGREDATFYGMYYTYSPVWHDPPSNNWFGFQCWGLQRSAELFHEVSEAPGGLGASIRPNLEILLDRFVVWVLDNVDLVDDDDFLIPDTLSWVSDTEVVGQTTTAANLEGKFEYLPTLEWDDSGDYGAFWNASTVPNTNLHCSISVMGSDLGVASSLANLLIHYAQAKRNMSKFNTTIPNSSHEPEEAFVLADELLSRIWETYRDEIGITREESRADYARFDDPVYIPASYSGEMPNGDDIETGSTFISIRSFMMDDPDWPEVAAYLANPGSAPVPTFTYHRFWQECEYATACAAMQYYFNDLL